MIRACSGRWQKIEHSARVAAPRSVANAFIASAKAVERTVDVRFTCDVGEGEGPGSFEQQRKCDHAAAVLFGDLFNKFVRHRRNARILIARLGGY